MTLLERLSENGIKQEVATEIHIEIHRPDGNPVLCRTFPDGSDITIIKGRRRTVAAGHVHVFTEKKSVAGKSKTRIGHMVEDVHTLECVCGQKVSVSYKAPH